MERSPTYLSPYAFTRVRDYIGMIPKNAHIAPDVMASAILKATPNIRKTAEYQNTKSCYYDCTMSCDRGEAKGWLKAFMERAINYGEQTKNLDWKEKYLAAYDILKDIK